jgi:signal transduction histidine kinase/integral membrane sensor domain MASE1
VNPYRAALATAAGYWVGTQVGLLLTPTGLAVSVMWPPNAMLLAVLMMTPRSWWPGYLLAILPVHLATQLLHGIPLVTSVGWFFTNTGEAVLAAACLRRLRPPRELFQTFGGVLLFLTVGVIAVTGLMSFIDAAVVVLTGFGQDYWLICRQRFASNALATLTLVPAIVMIGTSSPTRLRTIRTRRYLEGGLLALSTLVIVNLLSAWYGHTPQGILGLAYSLLPLLFWAAVRFGPFSVSLLQLVSTSAILWAALNLDPFLLADVLPLQMLLAMLNGLSLTLSVVVSERRRLQSLHSEVLNSMCNAVAITDADGVVIDANTSWMKAGQALAPCRLDGVPVHADYFDDRHAVTARSPDRPRMLAGLERVLTGSRALFEMEYSCQEPDALRWFSISVVPLKGAQRGAVITHSDITERKRNEAVTLQLREELTHAGRVMTMGMLSASLTHELSQPLSAILTNGQAAHRLIGRHSQDGAAELQEILSDIIAASRRAGGILRQLRRLFVSGPSNNHQPLDLNEIVRDVLDLMRSDLMRRGITVVRRSGPALPSVLGDRMQLQQLVLNLILNACDAMHDNPVGDRQVTVTTTAGEAGVQLSVEDVGTGIRPDQLGSIFEPLFTTRGEGLGLGLALCRWIMMAHGGQVRAENNTGRGATFHCLVPYATEQADGRSDGVSPLYATTDERDR